MKSQNEFQVKNNNELLLANIEWKIDYLKKFFLY